MKDATRSRRRFSTSTVGSVLALLAFSSLAISGCTSARNALGTNSSPCYLAIPVARDAVHDRGTFGGVRLITVKQLATRTHLLKVLKERGGPKLKDVCVVEYKGTYSLDQVEDPIGRAPDKGVGNYAIVVVSRTTNKLIGTFVRVTLPVRFRHLALRARLPETVRGPPSTL